MPPQHQRMKGPYPFPWSDPSRVFPPRLGRLRACSLDIKKWLLFLSSAFICAGPMVHTAQLTITCPPRRHRFSILFKVPWPCPRIQCTTHTLLPIIFHLHPPQSQFSLLYPDRCASSQQLRCRLHAQAALPSHASCIKCKRLAITRMCWRRLRSGPHRTRRLRSGRTGQGRGCGTAFPAIRERKVRRKSHGNKCRMPQWEDARVCEQGVRGLGQKRCGRGQSALDMRSKQVQCECMFGLVCTGS